MQKQELINKIHGLQKETVTKKLVESIIDAYTCVQEDALVKDGSITIGNICSLKVVERKEHQGRNPQTGEMMHIPAKKTIKAVMTKNMKGRLNK